MNALIFNSSILQTFPVVENCSRVQQSQGNQTYLSKLGEEVGQHEAEGPTEDVGGQEQEGRHQDGCRWGG